MVWVTVVATIWMKRRSISSSSPPSYWRQSTQREGIAGVQRENKKQRRFGSGWQLFSVTGVTSIFFYFLRLQSATLCLQKKEPISPQWGREIAVDDWSVNCSALYGDCSERYIGRNVKPQCETESEVGAMNRWTGAVQYVSTKLLYTNALHAWK